MICSDPFVGQGGIVYGCGQCMPCRYNRRRVWSHRIMLEATQHEHNCFLTLTYDNDHLPSDGSLDPKHLSDFLKRLRYHYSDLTIRYFACGEYGDDSWRPHYHLAVFGLPTCERGQSRYDKGGLKCCHRCSDVRKIWGYGNVYLGVLEPHSAQYVSGYVVKKMTHRQDMRLNGRHPEFARMSLKPGIGANAMVDVASDMLAHRSVGTLDVSELGYGKTSRPLGRYLTKKLRAYRGLDEKAPQSVLDKVQAEMHPVRMAARSSKDDPSVKSQYLKAQAPRLRSFEARRKLYHRRKTL